MQNNFKELPLEKHYHVINYGPCVIVTSGDGSRANAAPIAWVMPVNDEPALVAIAVADGHYTAELIKKTGEFVINVPDEKMLAALTGCGKVSGRNEDKIKKFNLALGGGKKVGVPHLEDSIGYLECRVKDAHPYDGVILFVATVQLAAVRPDLYDGCIIPEKAKAVHHLGGSWFALTTKRFKA